MKAWRHRPERGKLRMPALQRRRSFAAFDDAGGDQLDDSMAACPELESPNP